MADNASANDRDNNPVTFAMDDIGGVKWQRVKVSWGVDGSAVDASASDPLPVAAASLPLPTGAATAAEQGVTNTALGTPDDAAATSESSSGSILAFLKALLRDYRARTPALSGGKVPVVFDGGNVEASFVDPLPAGSNTIGGVNIASALPAGTNNIGDVDVLSLPALPAGTNNIGDVDVLTVPTTATSTREYSLSNSIRVAFTSTSTTEASLPTLGTTREVRLCASQRCWIKWGTTGLSAAAAEAASFPIEANSPEVVRIPSGATHYRVIRDTADGNLHMAPVA